MKEKNYLFSKKSKRDKVGKSRLKESSIKLREKAFEETLKRAENLLNQEESILKSLPTNFTIHKTGEEMASISNLRTSQESKKLKRASITAKLPLFLRAKKAMIS